MTLEVFLVGPLRGAVSMRHQSRPGPRPTGPQQGTRRQGSPRPDPQPRTGPPHRGPGRLHPGHPRPGPQPRTAPLRPHRADPDRGPKVARNMYLFCHNFTPPALCLPPSPLKLVPHTYVAPPPPFVYLENSPKRLSDIFYQCE